MSLQNYIDGKREALREGNIAQTEDEKLAILERIANNTAQSNKVSRKEAMTSSPKVEVSYSDEQIGMMRILYQNGIKQNKVVSDQLKAANKSLAALVKYLKPKYVAKHNTDHPDVVSARKNLAERFSQVDGKRERDSGDNRSIMDDISDLLDFDGKGKGFRMKGRARLLKRKMGKWSLFKRGAQAAEEVAEHPGWFGQVANKLKGGASAASKLISKVGGGTWSAIKAGGSKLGGLLGDGAGALVKGGGSLLKGAGSVFKSLPGLASVLTVAEAGTDLYDVGKGNVSVKDWDAANKKSLWDSDHPFQSVGRMLSPWEMGKHVGSKINEGINGLGSWVTGQKDWTLGGAIFDAQDAVSEKFSKAVDTMGKGWDSFMKDFGATAKDWLANVGGTLSDWAGKVGDKVSGAWQGAKDWTAQKAGQVGSALQSGGKAVAGATKGTILEGAGRAAGEAMDWSGGKLGALSAKYEGRVDSANKDNVGYAFGKYQFNSARGGLQNFFKDNPEYAKQFAGLTPGSAEFNAKWKSIAHNDTKGFEAAQDKSAKKIWYDPAAQAAKKEGFKMDNAGLQQAIFSGSINHGGINTILAKAAKTKGFKDMTADQQIDAFYEARKNYVMSSKKIDDKTKAGLMKRYEKEQVDAHKFSAAGGNKPENSGDPKAAKKDEKPADKKDVKAEKAKVDSKAPDKVADKAKAEEKATAKKDDKPAEKPKKTKVKAEKAKVDTQNAEQTDAQKNAHADPDFKAPGGPSTKDTAFKLANELAAQQQANMNQKPGEITASAPTTPEVTPVSVQNPPAQEDASMGAGAAPSGSGGMNTTPSLDSMPLQVTDMGLVLLNMGHV